MAPKPISMCHDIYELLDAHRDLYKRLHEEFVDKGDHANALLYALKEKTVIQIIKDSEKFLVTAPKP